MVAIGAILAAVLTVINIGLALRTAWKEWKARIDKPHALEPALRDISAAIRENDRKLDEAKRLIREAKRRLEFE